MDSTTRPRAAAAAAAAAHGSGPATNDNGDQEKPPPLSSCSDKGEKCGDFVVGGGGDGGRLTAKGSAGDVEERCRSAKREARRGRRETGVEVRGADAVGGGSRSGLLLEGGAVDDDGCRGEAVKPSGVGDCTGRAVSVVASVGGASAEGRASGEERQEDCLRNPDELVR